jgi:hypothetical protein
MEKVIIYPKDDGSIGLIVPLTECGLTVEEIAIKDTGNGVPYRIVNRSELPDHHELFNAWQADFSKPDGVGVHHDEWFKAVEEGRKLEAAKPLGAPANIGVNMDKARNIWRDRIEATAKQKIAELRDLQDKYVDEGRSIDPILAKRKALRDSINDPAIDAARTPDELMAVWPSVLNDPV